jgi:hypothetical chaperone protein
VIRIGPDRRTRPDRAADILANNGARIGGTDFDSMLSLDAVMPLLGKGTSLINKNLTMPNALYIEIATWATINFAYTHKNERMLVELVAEAREPEKIGRLLTTVRERLGHRIAIAVEEAKIALSDSAETGIPLAFLAPGLSAPASRTRFERVVRRQTERLHQAASSCIQDAGLQPQDIHTIFFTGGSSRIPAVRAAVRRAAPAARPMTGSDLLSVALGLTREAGRLFG